MSQPPEYHVILVTVDEGLQSAVRERQPIGARLLCVGPEEWDRRPDLLADQVWIDLDHRPQRRCVSSQRCTYLYSDRRSVPKTLDTQSLKPKPTMPHDLCGLWDEVDVETSCQRGVACVASACVPAWLYQIHEIELARLLQSIVDTLPGRLGFDHVAIYLRSGTDGDLRLAKTSLRRPLDRTVAVDDPLHAVAMVARRAEVQVKGSRVLAPLVHEGASIGVLQLEGGGAGRMTDVVGLSGIANVLAKFVAHARSFERASAEGRIDELTGLYNYRWMREVVQKEVRRASRYRTPLSVLAIDLDNLKEVNDTRGHKAGDACLRGLAMTISQCLREIDSAARIGGDEFLVVLPRTNQSGALRVAERILRESRRNAPGRLSRASIGVCEWVEGCEVEQLLDCVDQAMYDAKRAGGDRVAARRV